MSRKFKFQISAILSGLLIGLFLANLLVAWLFPRLPSDFKRTALILETLQDSAHQPKTVLLGNSILMNGVDARLLNQLRPGKLTYNLSSPGQWFMEGALFYQNLPSSVESVVHFIFYTELERMVPLKPEVCRNFLMYGYKPQEETYHLLGEENLAYFQKNRLQLNAESRDILINFLNSGFRSLIRKDLALERQYQDLYFPNPYTQKLEEEALQKLIDRYQPKDVLTHFEPSPKSLEQLKKAGEVLKQKNIKLYLAIFPLNPRLTNITPSFRKDLSDQLAQWDLPNTKVLDYSESLLEEDFVDHWHPYKSGAEKLTRLLATQLAE